MARVFGLISHSQGQIQVTPFYLMSELGELEFCVPLFSCQVGVIIPISQCSKEQVPFMLLMEGLTL